MMPTLLVASCAKERGDKARPMPAADNMRRTLRREWDCPSGREACEFLFADRVSRRNGFSFPFRTTWPGRGLANLEIYLEASSGPYVRGVMMSRIFWHGLSICLIYFLLSENDEGLHGVGFSLRGVGARKV